jgi:NAD-dependent dihydropyrimidine dehydrogenase PreA subunit
VSGHVRDIVKIDEEKCDGCGLCVPSCAEGAIEIIEGKARLVADNLCDGLGNCLGTCPRGAITIERRSADAFDAVSTPEPQACGCPGAMARTLRPGRGSVGSAAADAPPASHPGSADRAARDTPSCLGHWPVQLHLLPVRGSRWQDADLLIAADCVGFAMPDFHERLLDGRTLAVGCPKLDDLAAYIEKLTAVLRENDVKSVTVAHMEVPCCTGISAAVRRALAAAKKSDLLFRDLVVGVDGRIRE